MYWIHCNKEDFKMDTKILEILLDMQKDLKGVQSDINEIKQEMNDRFDVCDMKLNAIKTNVVKISKN